MGDVGFPGQHTTTTTVQQSTTTVDVTLRYDPSYLRTIPGILKVAQVLLNLIGFICIECGGAHSYSTSRGPFFNFVAMTGFWFTGILLLFYLFHIVEKFYRIPWLKIELVFCAIWTCLYLIAASLAVAYNLEAFEAAGFFGYCAMIVYGVDAFFKLKAIQNGEIAQGERVITKQTSSVTSPAY